MKPAMAVMPFVSMVLSPRTLGAAPSLTAAILPSWTTIAPCSITCPAVMMRAFAMTRSCDDAAPEKARPTETSEIAIENCSGHRHLKGQPPASPPGCYSVPIVLIPIAALCLRKLGKMEGMIH